jgi:hypothetical protein
MVLGNRFQDDDESGAFLVDKLGSKRNRRIGEEIQAESFAVKVIPE